MKDISLERSLLAAKLSLAAYTIKEQALITQVELLNVRYLGRVFYDDFVAFVATNTETNKTYVVIQGTRVEENTDFDEIWDDLDPGRVVVEGAQVHAGFWNPLVARWPEIKALIPKGTSTLQLTGHSLGGVRAHLAMMLAINDGYEVECISFGAPKGADASFWKILNHPIERWVDYRDLAPTWPFRATDLTQPAPLWWIDGSGDLQIIFARDGLNLSVGDHDITKYIAKITKMMG